MDEVTIGISEPDVQIAAYAPMIGPEQVLQQAGEGGTAAEIHAQPCPVQRGERGVVEGAEEVHPGPRERKTLFAVDIPRLGLQAAEAERGAEVQVPQRELRVRLLVVAHVRDHDPFEHGDVSGVCLQRSVPVGDVVERAVGQHVLHEAIARHEHRVALPVDELAVEQEGEAHAAEAHRVTGRVRLDEQQPEVVLGEAVVVVARTVSRRLGEQREVAGLGAQVVGQLERGRRIRAGNRRILRGNRHDGEEQEGDRRDRGCREVVHDHNSTTSRARPHARVTRPCALPARSVAWSRGTRMCLAVPLEIVELTAGRKARVRRGDGTFEIDVSLLARPCIGDFVLVHAGFAIETLEPDEAAATLRELDTLEGGPGAGS